MSGFDRLSVPVRLVLCAALIASASVSAAAAEPLRKVSVSAIGQVEIQPDEVKISAGVVSDGTTAMLALKSNSEKMEKLVAALKADGIAAKDIQTSNFSVRPNYVTPKGEVTPVLSGYHVNNTVNLTLHKIGRLGPILDELVKLGANQIGGIKFSLSDPTSAEDQARKQAMEKAAAKAKLYAEAAGATLAKVLTISEDQSEFSPFASTNAAPMVLRKSVPIEAGVTVARVHVHVVWALK